jgi:hypothetical protein
MNNVISLHKSTKTGGVMSSNERVRSLPAAVSEPAAEQIAKARERLGDLDASVFAQAVSVSPIQQNDLIRRAVRKLFGHGL